MNELEIFQRMGVDPSEIFITHLHIENLGEKLRLQCLYNMDKNLPFEIVLDKCQKFYWQTNDEELDLSKEALADVLAITFEPKDQQHEVIVETVEFELIVTCGKVDINKDWQE